MNRKNQDLELSACRFYEDCDLKKSFSPTCQSDFLARNYYGRDRPCGCYRERLRNEKSVVEKVIDFIRK